MPGNELIGNLEYQEVKKYLKKVVAFYMRNFDKEIMFRVRSFENQISKYFKSRASVCVSLSHSFICNEILESKRMG